MINPSGAAPSNNPEPPTANTAVSQYSVEALLAKSDPRIGRCYLFFSFSQFTNFLYIFARLFTSQKIRLLTI